MAQRVHAPEAVQTARRLYEEGRMVRDIVLATGLSEGTLYYWLDGGPPGTPAPLPPIPRRRQRVIGQRRAAFAASRPSLINRLWRTAERQVADIETRLIAAGGSADTLEKDARTLAVLARTVRDLVAIDTEQTKGATDKPDEEGPSDVDDFRQRVAAKMAELAAQRAGA